MAFINLLKGILCLAFLGGSVVVFAMQPGTGGAAMSSSKVLHECGGTYGPTPDPALFIEDDEWCVVPKKTEAEMLSAINSKHQDSITGTNGCGSCPLPDPPCSKDFNFDAFSADDCVFLEWPDDCDGGGQNDDWGQMAVCSAYLSWSLTCSECD